MLLSTEFKIGPYKPFAYDDFKCVARFFLAAIDF